MKVSTTDWKIRFLYTLQNSDFQNRNVCYIIVSSDFPFGCIIELWISNDNIIFINRNGHDIEFDTRSILQANVTYTSATIEHRTQIQNKFWQLLLMAALHSSSVHRSARSRVLMMFATFACFLPKLFNISFYVKLYADLNCLSPFQFHNNNKSNDRPTSDWLSFIYKSKLTLNWQQIVFNQTNCNTNLFTVFDSLKSK